MIRVPMYPLQVDPIDKYRRWDGRLRYSVSHKQKGPLHEPARANSERLNSLQRATFDYFVYEVNPLNGLVVDKTQEHAPPASQPSVWRVGVSDWRRACVHFPCRSRRTNAHNPAILP